MSTAFCPPASLCDTTVRCTPGGKDKLNFMLEWVIAEIPSEKDDEADLVFISFDHFFP